MRDRRGWERREQRDPEVKIPVHRDDGNTRCAAAGSESQRKRKVMWGVDNAVSVLRGWKSQRGGCRCRSSIGCSDASLVGDLVTAWRAELTGMLVVDLELGG